MTELETLMLDVTGTLNHNGFDEVSVDSDRNTNCDFTVRLGYWEQLPDELEQNLQEYHSVRIEEQVIEDEDCGYLYYYEFTIVDEDTGYTLNELNELDSNYSEESDYLMSLGADDTWGIA
jgi:hypothetical protein